VMVVVDDGPIDATRPPLNHPGVRIVTPGRKLAAAEARNLGARNAKGDILLFSDDDVVCDPHTVSTHARIHSERPRMLCLGYVNAIELTPFQAEQHRLDAHVFACEARDPHRGGGSGVALSDPRASFAKPDSSLSNEMSLPWTLAWTLNTSVPANTFTPFDESFEVKGSEDLEWAYRLHKSQHEIWLGPAARTCHIPHLRDRLAEIEIDRRNVRRFLAKWPDLSVEAVATFDCLHAEKMHSFMQSATEIAVDQPDGQEIAREVHCAIGGPVNTLLLVGLVPNRRASHAVTVVRIDTPARITCSTDSLGLLGASMPYEDKQFPCAVVGGVSHLMPEGLLCRILQETLRVARHVMIYIPRAGPDGHLKNLMFAVPRPYWCKRYYFSNEFEDFAFGRKRILRTGTLIDVNWAPRMKSIIFGHDAWHAGHPVLSEPGESRYDTC